MIEYAEVVIEALYKTGLDKQVEYAMPVTWHQGARFIKATNPHTKALGYTIMLTALLETPGGAASLVEAIRDMLQDTFDEVVA